jgi:hypothetical protein
VGIAAVGKVGRHEARVCGVVGAVAGADIEGELNLAALVEALADFMLEVTAAEAEPTVAEGSKGEGGADGVEGFGERRESADDAEQGSVIGGLGAVEGWGATI